MSKPYGTIYVARSPDGRCYVGASTLSAADRWRAHVHRAHEGSTTPLHQAIRELGWEAFMVTPVASALDLEGLRDTERAIILQEDSMVPRGYNKKAGGGGGYRGADAPSLLNLRITVDLVQQLRKAAKMEKRTPSALARILIEDGLARMTKPKARPKADDAA